MGSKSDRTGGTSERNKNREREREKEREKEREWPPGLYHPSDHSSLSSACVGEEMGPKICLPNGTGRGPAATARHLTNINTVWDREAEGKTSASI